MRALLVFNSYSGRFNTEKVNLICQRLKAKYDYIESFGTCGVKSITYKLMEVAGLYDLVVVLGGDGSLHEAVNGLMRSKDVKKPTLAYIPLGTCNDVGHSLGLNGNINKIIDSILEDNRVKFDVFKANDEYFIYALAAGYLTEISYLAPSKSKKKIGKMAYYLQALKCVKKNKNIDIEIESANNHIRGTYSIMLALNTRYLAGFRIHRKGKSYLNDGLLNITLIRKTHRLLNIIDFALFLLLGDRYTHNILHFSVSEFKLRSKNIISFNSDGEHMLDDNELNVSVINNALEVIVDKKVKNKYFMSK